MNRQFKIFLSLCSFLCLILGFTFGRTLSMGIDYVMTLEYLKIVISFPFVLLVLGFTCLYLFHSPIKKFLSELRRASMGAGDKTFQLEREAPEQSVSMVEHNIVEPRPRIVEAETTISAGATFEAHAEVLPRQDGEIADLQSQNVISSALYESLKQQLEEVYEWVRFERFFSVMYGTQFEFLDYLSLQEGNAVNGADVQKFYKRFLEKNNYEDSDMTKQNWTEYLVEGDFLAFEGEPPTRVRLTPFGLRFVQYLKTNYSAGFIQSKAY